MALFSGAGGSLNCYSPHCTTNEILPNEGGSYSVSCHLTGYLPCLADVTCSFAHTVVDDKARTQQLTACFSLTGRRQHSNSILHDQRLMESMDTPHVYLRNSRKYSWLLIFAQVTLGCIFLRCRELLCRNSLNDQVSSALENFFEVVSLLRGLLGGCFGLFVSFFLSYLDFGIEQSVIIFLLGLQFSAFAAACVCECVWVRLSVCVCLDERVLGVIPQFCFSFFCVKIFFYRFSRVNHCLLYEYFNELYTVWMKCYLKKKQKLLYPIKFILNFEQMNVFK